MASTATLSKTVLDAVTQSRERSPSIETVEISHETNKKLFESVVSLLSSWRGIEWKRSAELEPSETSKNG